MRNAVLAVLAMLCLAFTGCEFAPDFLLQPEMNQIQGDSNQDPNNSNNQTEQTTVHP